MARLARVFDVEDDWDHAYIVMEWAVGDTLCDLLTGGMDSNGGARIVAEALARARPLLEAETQRIEHRIQMALGVGAALHRQSCGLVEDDEFVVAVDHRALHHLDIARPRLGCRPWRR